MRKVFAITLALLMALAMASACAVVSIAEEQTIEGNGPQIITAMPYGDEDGGLFDGAWQVGVPQLSRVVDQAGLLTFEEISDLEARAGRIVAEYGFDVVIVTARGLDGKTRAAYADDFYDYNGYGVGPDADGILILVSEEGRWMSTCGYGITAFTDHNIQVIGQEIGPIFDRGRVYEGFSTFLTRVEECLVWARSGAYEDAPAEPPSYSSDSPAYRYGPDMGKVLLIGGGIGLVIALIVVSIMKAGMKTARPQAAAHDYVRKDSFRLIQQGDLFLYSNTVRKLKPQDDNNTRSGGGFGGGGSSTHTSSSGRTHGGGGF